MARPNFQNRIIHQYPPAPARSSALPGQTWRGKQGKVYAPKWLKTLALVMGVSLGALTLIPVFVYIGVGVYEVAAHIVGF